MRKILLPLIFTVLGFSGIQAQDMMTCELDTARRDSIYLIEPAPYDPSTPEGMTGGIPDTACAGQFFEFTFSILFPDTVSIGDFGLPVASISFATEGAITYDTPLADFDYVCNPPNCVFTPDSLGCVKIFGTPALGEDGEHEVNFSGYVDFGGFGFPITFPNPELAPGTYNVVVRGSEDPACLTSSTERILAGFDIRNSPNPFSYSTDIVIDAETTGEYEFRVHDVLGKQVHRQVIHIVEGQNTLAFDGQNLSEGMYLFSLSDGRSVITKKMIVNR